MSDIERLRGLLRDRQVKEGARGTAFSEVHLDTTLIDDLIALKVERQAIIDATPKGDGRLSAAPEPDTADVDERIAAKEDEIRATTVRLDFTSISSVQYQEIVNQYPDVDEKEAERAKFLDALVDACLTKITIGTSDPIADPKTVIAELREQLTFGEWSPIREVVYSLNRRKLSVPFSSKPSSKTQEPAGR